MRKAFSLVELLVIIIIVPLLLIVISKMFNTLLTETPRLWENVQLNATMINMFSQIQKDMDKAADIPQSKGDFESNDKLLLIEWGDVLIGYELVNDQVIRHILSGSESSDTEPRIWDLPDVKIQWQIRKKENKAYAVEIQNHIEYQKAGRLEKKLANAHLYFLGVP